MVFSMKTSSSLRREKRRLLRRPKNSAWLECDPASRGNRKPSSPRQTLYVKTYVTLGLVTTSLVVRPLLLQSEPGRSVRVYPEPEDRQPPAGLHNELHTGVP